MPHDAVQRYPEPIPAASATSGDPMTPRVYAKTRLSRKPCVEQRAELAAVDEFVDQHPELVRRLAQ
jgi:hypothetical protein